MSSNNENSKIISPNFVIVGNLKKKIFKNKAERTLKHEKPRAWKYFLILVQPYVLHKPRHIQYIRKTHFSITNAQVIFAVTKTFLFQTFVIMKRRKEER